MYTKTQWVDNTTPIDKDNLNKIEQGIYDNSLVVDAVTNTLNPTDTETYKTAELTEGQITDVIGISDIVIKGQTEQDGTPTPSSPVDVNVVSGSNVIEINNKNLFDKSNIIEGYFDGNILRANPAGRIAFRKCAPNTTYTISKVKDQRFAVATTKEYPNDKKNHNIYDLITNNYNTEITITTSEQSKYLVIFYYFSGASQKEEQKIKDSIQIELGTTATTYEQHQGKELPLDLGSIELCKIGDYQDYFYKSGSKWYLHKEINKITSYNGETISTSYVSTTGKLSTGAKVYYVVNSTNTEITNTTLISQLEAIYNAPLYEQTNITQTNNDLPMVLDITACKDNINGIKAWIRK